MIAVPTLAAPRDAAHSSVVVRGAPGGAVRRRRFWSQGRHPPGRFEAGAAGAGDGSAAPPMSSVPSYDVVVAVRGTTGTGAQVERNLPWKCGLRNELTGVFSGDAERALRARSSLRQARGGPRQHAAVPPRRRRGPGGRGTAAGQGGSAVGCGWNGFGLVTQAWSSSKSRSLSPVRGCYAVVGAGGRGRRLRHAPRGWLAGFALSNRRCDRHMRLALRRPWPEGGALGLVVDGQRRPWHRRGAPGDGAHRRLKSAVGQLGRSERFLLFSLQRRANGKRSKPGSDAPSPRPL